MPGRRERQRPAPPVAGEPQEARRGPSPRPGPGRSSSPPARRGGRGRGRRRAGRGRSSCPAPMTTGTSAPTVRPSPKASGARGTSAPERQPEGEGAEGERLAVGVDPGEVRGRRPRRSTGPTRARCPRQAASARRAGPERRAARSQASTTASGGERGAEREGQERAGRAVPAEPVAGVDAAAPPRPAPPTPRGRRSPMISGVRAAAVRACPPPGAPLRSAAPRGRSTPASFTGWMSCSDAPLRSSSCSRWRSSASRPPRSPTGGTFWPTRRITAHRRLLQRAGAQRGARPRCAPRPAPYGANADLDPRRPDHQRRAPRRALRRRRGGGRRPADGRRRARSLGRLARGRRRSWRAVAAVGHRRLGRAAPGAAEAVRRLVKDVLLPVAVAIGLAFVIQASVAKPYEIPTPSMAPTIEPGDRIIANRLVYRFRDIERGDIIVFDPPPSATRECGERRRRRHPVRQARDRPARRPGRGEPRGRHHDGQRQAVRRSTGRSRQLRRPRARPGRWCPRASCSCSATTGPAPATRTSGSRDPFLPEDNVIGQAEITYWPLSHAGLPELGPASRGRAACGAEGSPSSRAGRRLHRLPHVGGCAPHHAEYGVDSSARDTRDSVSADDLPVLRQPRAPRRRVARGRHQGRHPAPARVPALRAPLHHLRALRGDAARGGQELRRAPAVRPRQAARGAPARLPQAAGADGRARGGGARHRGRAAQPAAPGGPQLADRRARAAAAEGDRPRGLRALRVGLPRVRRRGRVRGRARPPRARAPAAAGPVPARRGAVPDARRRPRARPPALP